MKKFLALVLIVVCLFVCVSGCNSNILSNSTTSSATTTTVPTTLSEEEILNNRINYINDDLIESLKGDYNFLDVKCAGYINFQEFIHGLESNPSDYFFLGTEAYELSTLYDNTKFYKNSDALEQLKEWDIADGDYLLLYNTVKKDTYGKEQVGIANVLVKENGAGGFTWWLYDGLEENSLGQMIIGVAAERCNINYLI